MLTRLLRPRAVLSHLLVLAVAVTCVLLGQWQLDRLGQVRTHNALLETRLDDPPVDLAGLLGEEPDPDALEFRPVEVTGTFRPDEEVLQRGRQHQQQQGFHVLTPLEVEGGGVVLVRRGWVPARLSEPPVDEAAPPDGEVRLTGILEKPVGQPGFGPRDPEEGTLARVFHADTERLERQIDGDLYPMVLRLDAPAGASFDTLPVGLEAPVLDEANHLSYALQWFSFAVLAVVTYAAWLWSRERRSRRGGDDDPDAAVDVPPSLPPSSRSQDPAQRPPGRAAAGRPGG